MSSPLKRVFWRNPDPYSETSGGMDFLGEADRGGEENWFRLNLDSL